MLIGEKVVVRLFRFIVKLGRGGALFVILIILL